MIHKRTDSVESNTSTLSTLTSCSSASSVEFYEEKLKPGIDSVKESDTPLQDLADKAEAIIKDSFAPHSSSIYTYKKGSKEILVGLDKIMLAMLACAEEGGGESGKRYVAAAIVACFKQENKIEALQALGTTWLTHLLFIFKTSRGHGNQRNKTPADIATPTIDQTAIHLLEGAKNRAGSFRDDVLLRDGYKCVVTGFQDYSHPAARTDVLEVQLVAAHILRRAICHFDEQMTSKSYKSGVTTFAILVNFTHLSVKNVEALHGRIDDADNGISLENNTHVAFDNFHWCLKQTETKHVYDLKIFKENVMLKKPENNRIVFKDRSKDLPSDNSCEKMDDSVDLPNPLYIRIHATIAGVLNMSGAGKFFDELLYAYKDDEGNVPPVRSWSELEEVMEKQLMKDMVTAQFGMIKVQ